ncbi:hypothetical protein CTheo_7554 [Ceratobasidium theobromae]|uniref:Uncharacterized protein n=1 Tax=Ceratobasidium theobromae TaxID=1582974 RepID=A0A5N5QBG1_9AGAM|nr:hypothetical protein CTheo_7554 [Ceratobasidium theobromae]
MVKFAPQVVTAIIGFAVAVEALASPNAENRLSNSYQSRMVRLRAPSSAESLVGGPWFEKSDAAEVPSPPSPPHSPLSDGQGELHDRRFRHRKHRKHGKSNHRHSDRRRYKDPSLVASTSNVTGNTTATEVRHAFYFVKGQDVGYLPKGVDGHSLVARGASDSLIPIVGLIHGLEGIVELVPELLDGVLGPALGGLVISPNEHGAQALNSPTTESSYTFAATTKDPSTIWLVDEGELAQPGTGSLDTAERMVSLQMAFVDPKSGEYQAFCATYERDPTKPVVLGVVPCQQAGPSESQMFAYNPETNVLRAIWNKVPGGRAIKKRQVMVGEPGSGVQTDGAEGAIVLVFQAANATTSNSVNAHDMLSQGMSNVDNSTMNSFHVGMNGGFNSVANGTSGGWSVSLEPHNDLDALPSSTVVGGEPATSVTGQMLGTDRGSMFSEPTQMKEASSLVPSPTPS